MSGSHAHIYISYGVSDFLDFMGFLWGGLSGKVEGSYFIEGRALIVHKLIIYYY
jgi:hypothetical protein